MSAEQQKILVVEDDVTYAQMLQSFFSKKGFDTTIAFSAQKGLAEMQKSSFDLVLTDFKMPGMNGIEFQEEINRLKLPGRIIFITSHADVKLAVRAMKLGASDFLTKPINPEALAAVVQNELQPKPKRGDNTNFISGSSGETKKVNEYVNLVGPTQMSVLIEGESGTGKEYVAREIHQNSKRKNKPFVAIDCGALSKDLAASELFGHIKGSFTGAVSDRPGQFEYAEGGTLFLDEIGNLSYETQVKLLRAIQEKVIRRIGGNNDIPVDVRLLAATNEDLMVAIQDGAFREDLYHRINEFKIEISPLRDRTGEVEQFAGHFLEEANQELEKEVEGFDSESLKLLNDYSWPGNLRELKNAVKRAVLLTGGSLIKTEALPSEIRQPNKPETFGFENFQDTADLKKLESAMEKQKIQETLEKVRYNKTKAARLLNIDRKTLYNKIRTYGLEA